MHPKTKILTLITASLSCIAASQANAGIIPSASPYQSSMAFTSVINPTGTYSLSDSYGSVIENVTLAPQPSVSASSSASGGTAISAATNLTYYFGYFTSQTTPIQVLVSMKSNVVANASNSGKNYDSIARAISSLSIDGLNSNFFGFDCSYVYSSGAINSAMCDISGTVPISDTTITITPNTFYTVSMSAYAESSSAIEGLASASAWLDPIFTIAGPAPTDGLFVFSNGIGNSLPNNVPEPATAALAITGLAALARIRRIHKPS